MKPNQRLANALALMSAFGLSVDSRSQKDRESRELTERDQAKLAQAQAKRERRAQKRIAQAKS